MRGSDPDAALYWLARMIDGGEDPLFIARRLVILASEDIGLADSAGVAGRGRGAAGGALRRHAGGLLSARARDALSRDRAEEQQRSAARIGAAMDDVDETRNDPVPLHLRNAPTGLMRELGYGRGLPLRARRLRRVQSNCRPD